MTTIDPLTGPSTMQESESVTDYAYRHAYRFAYGRPEGNHYSARSYAEYTESRFRRVPELLGTWDHSIEYFKFYPEFK